MRTADQQSTLSMILDVFRQGSGLVEKEIKLAKTEVGENISRAGFAVGLLLGAAVMAMICLNLLAGALVTLIIAAGIAPGWATLIVAGGFGIVAALLVAKAVHDLKASSLIPNKAMDNVRKDVRTLKEATFNA